MGIVIKEVRSKKDLKAFVKFPLRLYRGHPLWVPPLIMDEMGIFDPEKNPSYENAESKQFLACEDGRVVGRVAAVLSHAANGKYGTKNMRFGWFEAENNPEAARALFGAVEAWAKERGMETVTGPHGFCDFDPNGMMVEGFGELATIAGNYNHPYIPELVEQCGYKKEIDWVEFKTRPPAETGIPDKLLRIAKRVQERGKFRILKFKAKKEVLARAPELFHLLDAAYEEIYGAVPLTERQVNYYIKKYIPYVDPDLIKVVVNEKNEMIGFMITMPSLTRSFQKAKGRLFPLGWLWILRGLRQHEILDFLLAGIRKDCRGLGVDLLMVIAIGESAIQKGFKFCESNQELETNTKIQAQWKYFDPVQHKRRRMFKKTLA